MAKHMRESSAAVPQGAAVRRGAHFRSARAAGEKDAAAPAPASPAHFRPAQDQDASAQVTQQMRPIPGSRAARPAGTARARAGQRPAPAARGAGGAVPPAQPPHAPRAARQPEPPRRKKRSAASVVSTVLIVLGVALLLVAGGLFIYTQLGYNQARESYGALDRYAVADTAATDELAGLPRIDFGALAAINPDIVGWIYCPNNELNYPVVQTDDNDTYLHTLFDGTDNATGAIFMDKDDTAPGCVDQQTTLYGHHMLSGMMFNFVDVAEHDQATFDAIGTVYYFTRDATYVFEPLFTTRVAPDELQVRAPSPEGGLASYLQGLYATATSHAEDAPDRISTVEKVLTLVTCNYDLSEKQRSVLLLGLADTLPASTTTASATTEGE